MICPQCHNETMVERLEHTYCAYCAGFQTELPQPITPAVVEQTLVPEDPEPVCTKEESMHGLSKLAVITNHLNDLSKEFEFVIPERVYQVLEMAGEIIEKRGEQDEEE
ncbi:hypothetical protein LCGC14_2851590 [marine sediment metagenome]|uniref:Uncharacterized protein n=1 Tax=marine sediment metagenome TaxID=412755 RepID=A0A0F9AZ52_9ZZZZ